VLEPAKIATEYLSSRSINLLSGEGAIKFLIDGIKEKSSCLAKSFKEALIDRIENRRDPTLISLILYLSNHDALNKQSSLGRIDC